MDWDDTDLDEPQGYTPPEEAPQNYEQTDIATMNAQQQLNYGSQVADPWMAGLLDPENAFMKGVNAANKDLGLNNESLNTKENMNMHSTTGTSNTQQNEGFRDHVYKDTLGFDTIGFGHKLTKAEIASGKYKNGISRAEAQALYEHDEELHTAGLYKNAPWAKEQPQEVQEVLKDMAYNMGPAFIKKWPKFAAQLRAGDYKGAARNMLNSTYAKQVKGRADRNASRLTQLNG